MPFPPRLRVFFAFFAIVAGLLAPSSVRSQDGVQTTRATNERSTANAVGLRWFKLQLDSKATMKMQGQTQQIDAHTTIGYHRAPGDEEKRIEVGLDAINVKASVNGKVQIDSFQSKEKLVVIQGNQTQTVWAKDAEAPLQQMLSDTFDYPACVLIVDDEGEIAINESLLRPGAQSIEDQGIVANIVFFHAPFPAEKKSWNSTRRLSMGNGGFVEGELTYTTASQDGSVHTVNVSGTLQNPLFQPAGTQLLLRDTSYEIAGSQSYDTDLGDWVSGDLVAELQYDMATNEMPVGNVTGTIGITLRQLDAAVTQP